MHIGVPAGGGGEGGCNPPVTEIFEISRAKRWRFGQKFSEENTLKGSQSQRRANGGEVRGAAAPPPSQKFLKFFGQNADDSGKSTLKHSMK